MLTARLKCSDVFGIFSAMLYKGTELYSLSLLRSPRKRFAEPGGPGTAGARASFTAEPGPCCQTPGAASRPGKSGNEWRLAVCVFVNLNGAAGWKLTSKAASQLDTYSITLVVFRALQPPARAGQLLPTGCSGFQCLCSTYIREVIKQKASKR